ncbi:MAG: CinA family protein [Campylobacterota bacterium]|nr:CinA family protein [Campylobacterota bacterium]
MKKQLLFVGNKFTLNRSFQRYILREVEKKSGQIDAIFFFQESDNSLFLHLEKVLLSSGTLIIVTTKSSFSVIGKLLSTVTSDNQILKEQMLIPSQTLVFEQNSYLIKHEDSTVNVLMAEEGVQLPKLLIDEEERSAIIHIFEEDVESVQAMLHPLAQTYDVRLDYTHVVSGWVKLQIQSRRYGNIAQFIASVKQLLPKKVIAASNIAVYIIEKLMHHQRKVTFAESCTGGLLASFFTRESGASNVFDGSLVTYSNSLKANWLAVSDLNLERFGAVSQEIIEEMTDGALNVSYADYALAVSGIAGPDGGTEFKPVGTIFIGARSKLDNTTEECYFEGDRNYIQEQSTYYAVKMLLLLDKETFFE